jgi:hypothetical protein
MSVKQPEVLRLGPLAALWVCGLLGGVSGRAFAGSLGASQLHLRAGLVTGSVSSPDIAEANRISVPSALDFEFELLQSTRRSYFVRSLLAFDVGAAITQYMYTGVGFRYYLGSSGGVISASDGRTELVSVPRRRIYFSGELGYAQAVVQQFSETVSALTVNSSMIDAGLNAGYVVQLDRNLGLELQAGLGYGLGFSSVAAGALTFRFLGGVCFGF